MCSNLACRYCHPQVERLYTHGVLEDVEVLMECARDNIGDLTFQEQYDLTGMVFSVTVNSRREHGCARLLNYLTRSELSHSPHTHPFPPTPRRKYVAHVHVRVQTGYGNDLAATMKIPRAAICFVLFCACSPNVVIWSAVCASCAFTGLFEEVEVVCKDADGKICPWNPPGTKWSDGSMESDLHVNKQHNAIKSGCGNFLDSVRLSARTVAIGPAWGCIVHADEQTKANWPSLMC